MDTELNFVEGLHYERLGGGRGHGRAITGEVA